MGSIDTVQLKISTNMTVILIGKTI